MVAYRPLSTNNFEITSLTSRWQIAKEGYIGALFYNRFAVNAMAKGEEYSRNSHDAEAILAHYRVDKPSKRFYQL